LGSRNLKDIGELIGVGAILFGMFFVYAELRQNGTMARAEMSAESNRMFMALDEQARDPNFASILVKSRKSPKELTATERLQLNSYLLGVLRVYLRERYYYNRGIFDEWTSLIGPTAPHYFGSGYGRAYWDVQKKMFPTDIVIAIDEALSNVERIEFDRKFDAAVVLQLDQG